MLVAALWGISSLFWFAAAGYYIAARWKGMACMAICVAVANWTVAAMYFCG